MTIFDKILALTKQLFPTGRAFRIFFQSILEKLHIGLAASEGRAYQDALSTLDSVLPDNANFTVDDAMDWERRLGLITNLAVSLSDRKAAILRKINHPGTIPARQNYLYIQGQLQAAGFPVYVFENITPQAFIFSPPDSWTDETVCGNIAFVKSSSKLTKNSGGVPQSLGAVKSLTPIIPQGTTVIFSFSIKTIGTVNPGIYYVTVRFWNGDPCAGGIPCDNAFSISELTSPNQYNVVGIFKMTNADANFVEILCGLPSTPSSASIEISFNQVIQLGDAELGDFQLGESGQANSNLVANHIEESLDEVFNVGTNLRSTFIIGGTPLGTLADVDKNRKDEFRQLVLKLKPVQEIAVLLINYV